MAPPKNLDRLRIPETLDGDEGPPGAEALKAQISASQRQRPEEEDEDEDADPKLKRRYTFSFQFVDGNGRDYSGQFTNQVLSSRERGLAGALTSDLNANRPINSIPVETAQINYAVGWMTYSLRDPRPDWATDLSKVDDEKVLLALWGEVWSHQNTFLGRTDKPATKTPASDG